jgi:pyruvate-ferredoxin/flavodoxin oxidoreductase
MAKQVTFDGGEAAAYVAYRTNEVCAVFPITPSSAMAEFCEQWTTEGTKNLWGSVPTIAQLQSEGGAAGTLHGSLQTGALTTTFTASQGLLLMIPNMYKIAGELTSTVIHVAARSLATQGLSIFGDHQDVMSVRMTGFAQVVASSVQEAHDMALVSQAVTLKSRIPFIHFFDGFRTSHEINKITLLEDEQIRTMIDDELVFAHRQRALNPDKPFMRGTAQNPDTYFQGRESSNQYYDGTIDIFDEVLEQFFQVTGRRYQPFEYHGPETAERIIIMMGSGIETAIATAEKLNTLGDNVGVLNVRLYRPFSAKNFIAALPQSVQSIAVLDRTKEPGNCGEPLYKDVITELSQAFARNEIKIMPRIIGGRYGLSSKEFTPTMAARVFQELKAEQPKNNFTIGIIDDVTHTSLDITETLDIEPENVVRAMFFGLGSDGTVGANKNSIKIIGNEPQFHAQGYFVYDSKKAGSQTISHLRFGPDPIKAPYLIESANFIACHDYNFIKTTQMLDRAKQGATFLLNSPYDADRIWEQLPEQMQQQLIDKEIQFYVINGVKVAKETGMGRRINTVMQTCFFALSGVMPKDQAISKIKEYAEKTYAKKGPEVVQKNFAAIDQSLSRLQKVKIPAAISTSFDNAESSFAKAPEFVKLVTFEMVAGRGDKIPVSQLPADGTYPTGTTQWEKRNIAQDIPIWESDLCIQCGNCSIVCPHATIRAKFYEKEKLDQAPDGFKAAKVGSRGFPDMRYTIQVFPEDCTGCSLCVKACPAVSEHDENFKAINMTPKAEHFEVEKNAAAFFEALPYNDRARVDFSNVRGVQFLEPLFEFSSACAGCGETPYLKLITQLFGDRMLAANATGCSSIYGGNLPTTPWSQNSEGKGPAWSNSLFEDNAEFGLGYRLTTDQHVALARRLLNELKDHFDDTLVEEILNAPQAKESDIRKQRVRVAQLQEQLEHLNNLKARELLSVVDNFVRRSIWIIGGDGWAYDIGYGGIDHVLATGHDMNILVMDTEVYSNTGGQASKSTPIAAVAKFASHGKLVPKKDLALQAIAYGNVYVARIAIGASPQQTLQAFREAEAYDGPSVIIAYSPCIAHGINLENGLEQMEMAVKSGYWPLYRYNPTLGAEGKNPFVLDSLRPSIPVKEYAYNETRYSSLQRSNHEQADKLMGFAQQVVDSKWALYEEMATRNANDFLPDTRIPIEK